MSLKNLIGSASLALLFTGAAALAQPASQYQSGQATGNQNYYGHSHHGMTLSLEEKAMLKLNWRQQLKSLPSDQRRQAKQQLKQQWHAMDPHARQQQVAQLDTQWRQLPQSTREAALQRMQQHAQRKMQNRQSQGSYRSGYDGAPSYQGRSAGNGTPD